MNRYCLIILFCSCLEIVFSQKFLKFHEKKAHHVPKIFSNNDIVEIASNYNQTYLKDVLSNILVPRVVGTQGHENVKQFIINELTNLGWSVEAKPFMDVAPKFGQLEFTNIVGRLNPEASRYLVLACHYDSKYLPPRFDAATDSAVPCAMMLQIAHALDRYLKPHRTSDLSLKLIFFDGEEAFVQWSEKDSLYGARNLAANWENTPFPKSGDDTNILHSIDLLVLLDLLGTKDPKFYSFFSNTERWHSQLAKAEKKLKALRQIPAKQPLHFLEKSTYSHIEDDHIPFLRRDVPILHLIPIPFPKQWHTPEDDYSCLDFPTIASLNKILQVFVLSYLKGASLSTSHF